MEKRDSVKIETINGKIQVKTSIRVIHKTCEDGILICKVPSFKWTFAATDKEDMTKITAALLNSFLNHYFKYKPRQRSIPALATELYKLGFRTQHDMPSLINNQVRDTEFTSALVDRPSDFSGTFEVENKLEMEVAEA